MIIVNGHSFECRVDVVNPKTKEIQKIPFEVSKKKDFGFKTFEYLCSVTTESVKKRDLKKINLLCMIPKTKIIARTSGILSLEHPSAPNLYLRDRKGRDRNLILACLK